MTLSKKQKQQLAEHGFVLSADGDIVKVAKPARSGRVLSALKEGVDDGEDMAENAVKATGRGLARVGTEVVYYGVDVPTEAVKSTGKGIKSLASTIAESHRERVQDKQERREAKRAERAAKKAERLAAEAEALQKAAEAKAAAANDEAKSA